MPVLDNALLGAALVFTPDAAGRCASAQPVLRLVSAGARRIPRTIGLVDIGLDWVRQDPEPSRAVLEGILFGRTAPPRAEREQLRMPALVIGHPSDPLHPFSDADMVARRCPTPAWWTPTRSSNGDSTRAAWTTSSPTSSSRCERRSSRTSACVWRRARATSGIS